MCRYKRLNRCESITIFGSTAGLVVLPQGSHCVEKAFPVGESQRADLTLDVSGEYRMRRGIGERR